MNSKKILTHPSLVFANELKGICAPLKALNIVYFGHARVDEKGVFTAMSSEPDFLKLYLEKKYYNFDIHMAKLQLSEQFVLGDAIERQKGTEELYHDFNAFNFGHTFSILQENRGIKECFHFAAKLNNSSINQSYLQNLGLLKQFINYFTEKVNTHKNLKVGYDIKFKLDEQAGFFIRENALLLEEFKQKTQHDRIYFDKDRYLTKREWECLYWLAQGKTLEEIAVVFNITLRTVKAHMINIKEKFALSNQFQLGMLYQELSKLNILLNHENEMKENEGLK